MDEEGQPLQPIPLTVTSEENPYADLDEPSVPAEDTSAGSRPGNLKDQTIVGQADGHAGMV